MPRNNAVLDDLMSERDEARNAAIALAEAEDFEPTNPTFMDLQQRAEQLDARIDAMVTVYDRRDAAQQLDGRLARATQQRQQTSDNATRQLERPNSWGAAFIRSEEWTSYRGRGQSAQFELELDGGVQTRALPTGIAELVAAGLKPQTYTADLTQPPAPTPLLDNITQIQVSGNAIEYVSWRKTAGGAAIVAEKAIKPSAEWAPTVTPSTLDNVAVYTQLTRQLIEDYAAVRSMIDGELRRDVAREVEENAVAALNAAAPQIPDVEGADLLSAIRIGMGTVQAAGYTPSAVLLNPADWAELDVAIMGGTLGGPNTNQTFWGLRPIPSITQPVGGALVGDFRSAVHHYYRSAIALYVTDSHADTFLYNVFTLLAEQRSKTAVVRPQALADCSAAPVGP